jgi:tryptophanyl-tRNA synthetase
MSTHTILTGLRANNDLHIGNYLGALLPLIDMATDKAGEYQVNLFVPDLHSFTTPIDHAVLHDAIFENLRVFVAAGLPINHEDVHIYRQSYVSAHSELAWILDCFTGFGEMSRMTQFKDKISKTGNEPVTVGLFNYPVLMAADILLYGASYVPVGEDQRQHLEFARDVAERLNNRFATNLFTLPKSVEEQYAFFGKEQGLRIKDLVDPAKKMSKSDESGKGVLFMTDTPETARKKVMSATTDSFALIKFDKQNQPGIANLLEILALLTHQSLDMVIASYRGQTQYGPLKGAVADAVATFLQDFQAKLSDVHDDEIEHKLLLSESLMNEQANTTLLRVQKAVGLRS